MRRVFDAEQFPQLVYNPLVADRRIAVDVFLVEHLPELRSQSRETFAPDCCFVFRIFLAATAFAFIFIAHFLRDGFADPRLFKLIKFSLQSRSFLFPLFEFYYRTRL